MEEDVGSAWLSTTLEFMESYSLEEIKAGGFGGA